jgi:hypothetical protein
MENFTDQEIAVLLATRASTNAMTLPALASSIETTLMRAHGTIADLVRKNILEPLESYDGMIVYAFAGNDSAQAVYDEIYGCV